MRRIRLAYALLAAVMMIGIASGCGAASVKEEARNENVKDPGQEGEDKKDRREDNTLEDNNQDAGNTKSPENSESSESGEALGLLGEWQFVYSMSRTNYKDGTNYDYFTMADDEYGLDSAVIIRESEDGLFCDYKFNGYEFGERLYGVKLNYLEEPAFQGCDNDKWCYEFSGCFEDEESLKRVTLSENGMLIVSTAYDYEDPVDPEFSSSSVSEYRYLKKDDERLKDTDSIRYFDEVKVGNVFELVNSLQNNRRIIIEPGTYNFSKVTQDQIKNPKVQNIYNAVTFTELSNLKFEAAGGGEVLFCIDSAYEPVVTFKNCDHISIDGITVGHNVEKGYCTGSVLSFDNVSGLKISGCKLFGSGTYGIDAYYTYDINVSDTEIYECTYGLLDLRNIGNALFTDCKFRDSGDMSMLCISNAYDVAFENCSFTGNKVEDDRNYFVLLGERDSATFRNCIFKDNRFFTFSNREVTLENCVDENNSSKFKDSTSEEEVFDKESLLKRYEEVLARQKEIDDRISANSLLDQLTLNQLAFEEYDMWDGLLNKIWSYLGTTLDEKDMEKLRDEQKNWIKEKEAHMKKDAEGFQGGSMAPMIEYGSGADFTRKRVEEFISLYLK